MENKSFEQALSVPYTASLAARYAVATNYRAIAHPSLANYLALTSGRTWGVTDNAYRALPAEGLGDQLTAAGIPWRAYIEGLPADCTASSSAYLVQHNPFAYYGGRCPANVVPLTSLAKDLAADTPRFVWITPDPCHDTHDCPLTTGDRWLESIVPKIIDSAAWRNGGVLFITWDENDGSSPNRVATLVIAPNMVRHETATAHDHYSLLATIEDRLGIPRLGAARTATPIKDLISPSGR
jgi:phospholipase C